MYCYCAIMCRETDSRADTGDRKAQFMFTTAPSIVLSAMIYDIEHAVFFTICYMGRTEARGGGGRRKVLPIIQRAAASKVFWVLWAEVIAAVVLAPLASYSHAG
jgi:hypothetical protein